jgi:hypothetical protein
MGISYQRQTHVCTAHKGFSARNVVSSASLKAMNTSSASIWTDHLPSLSSTNATQIFLLLWSFLALSPSLLSTWLESSLRKIKTSPPAKSYYWNGMGELDIETFPASRNYYVSFLSPVKNSALPQIVISLAAPSVSLQKPNDDPSMLNEPPPPLNAMAPSRKITYVPELKSLSIISKAVSLGALMIHMVRQPPHNMWVDVSLSIMVLDTSKSEIKLVFLRLRLFEPHKVMNSSL